MITFKELKNNGFIAFLLILIIAVGILSYQNASDYNQLVTKNDSVKNILVQKEWQGTKLKEKIAIAEIIDISSIKVNAIKERRNDKHTSTSRFSKTDAFKIEFDLLENNVISPPKSVYIQITSNKKVVSPAKKVRLKNTERILCNDILTAEYNNKLLSVISFIDVDRNIINKDSYKINVFVDGHYINNTLI